MHYQVDSLWTILNMNWYEERIEDKIWMIHVTSFDVPITEKNPIVQNARVSNSRINRSFKSWRGVEQNRNNMRIQQQRHLKQGRGGLLVKWGRK